MPETVLQKMRGRVAQCRMLAAQTTDQRAGKILRQMATEIEADRKRLEAEASGGER